MMNWRIRMNIAACANGEQYQPLSYRVRGTSKIHFRMTSGIPKTRYSKPIIHTLIASRRSHSKQCLSKEMLSAGRIAKKPKAPEASFSSLVLACGQNICGQLGLATSIVERCKPQKVKIVDESNLDEHLQSVCAGAMHSCALTVTGRVYTWGCNDDGALGRTTGDIDDEYIPRLCPMPEEITGLCAGDTFTVAIGKSGRAYISGCFRSSEGLLGLFEYKQVVQQFIAIPLHQPIKQVACGADFCLLLTEHGELYSFGNNETGQLGRDTNGDFDESHAAWLHPSPVSFFKGQSILKLFAGGHGFFVLTERSTIRLFSCGANSFGQLGHPSKEPITSPFEIADFLSSSRIVKIACGLQHTLFLDSAGHVYSLGRSDDGRLGCEHLHDVIRPNRIEHLNNVLDIAAGGSVSFAIDNRGQIFSFGMGDTCQTGHGNEDIFVPTLVKGKQLEQRSIQQISVGAQHTLFLVKEVHCLDRHGFSSQ